MRPAREYLDYLAGIVDAAEKAVSFVCEMTFEQFRADDRTRFAVVRALEIVGEAAKRIPESICVRYSAVPWNAMAGMRDRLIHE